MPPGFLARLSNPRPGPIYSDWRVAAIGIVGTLLLLVDHYFRLTPSEYIDRLILYLGIPIVVTSTLFRESPGAYGFRLGDWRAGLALLLGASVAIAPVLWLVVQADEAMRLYYDGLAGGLPWSTFLDLLGWEFFFRGWLLFGFSRRFGVDAIWLQAIPFALAHIGKPSVETLSTIFGGVAFGWIAYRTRSFVWPLLLHWFVATFVILAASSVGS